MAYFPKKQQFVVATLVAVGAGLALGGCTGSEGPIGPSGANGANGSSCSVTDNHDGTKTISCADGTSVTVTDGNDGTNGSNGNNGDPGTDGVSCTVTDNGDGTKTISCTDDTSVIVRDGASPVDVFSLAVEVPKQLQVTITSVTIASPPVVSFTVTDGVGRGAVGLKAGSSGQLRFALAKLVPGTSGNPDAWQSYINSAATSHAGNTTATQATAERNGTLVDHRDGSYTYTFATDPSTAADPVSGALIGYNPALTHRLAIQLSGSINGHALPPVNGMHDFVPNGSPVTLTRNIAATASCNECHGKLSMHGGGRVDVDYCVMCHNPGTTDPDTVTVLDMPNMIHAIHGARERKAEGLPPYTVIGHNNSTHDFSHVTYPQATNNCLKCHSGDDAATPDGDNWSAKPYREACSGCHNMATAAIDHSGLSNSLCIHCHGPDGNYRVAEMHATEDATPNTPQVLEGAYNFTYEIESVTMADATHPAIEFRVLKDGVPFTLQASYTDLDRGPSFLLAWAGAQDGVDEPADYTNFGRAAAQPRSVALADIVSGSAGALTGPDAEGYYVATLSGTNEFPAGSSLRAVAMQGYWRQLDFFGAGQHLARHAISVEKAVASDAVRRQIVDSAKCANCHEWFQGHGGNRVYTTDVCVMCHVPNLTSSGRGASAATALTRLSAASQTAMTEAGYTPADPLTYPEEPQGFKDLVHGIHASEMRSDDFDFVREFGSSLSYYNMAEVTFPGVLNNCETCHKKNTYDVDLPAGVLASTVRTSGDADGDDPDEASVDGARTNLPNATDQVTTPVAAACLGCHDSVIAESHMVGHGALVSAPRSELTSGPAPVETCALCHGPGRSMDVSAVHLP